MNISALLSSDIENLEIKTATKNALYKDGIKHVGQLLRMSRIEVQRLEWIGAKGANQIDLALKKAGLSLSLAENNHYPWHRNIRLGHSTVYLRVREDGEPEMLIQYSCNDGPGVVVGQRDLEQLAYALLGFLNPGPVGWSGLRALPE